ncbi:MAG: M50 family metallopeptidase [Vulcanimicrobiota bacterium]
MKEKKKTITDPKKITSDEPTDKKDAGGIKSILILLGMVALAYFLWDTPVVYPLKLFVVILHEMSHGIAAIMTGGKILEIQIDPRIGGLCRYVKPEGFVGDVFVASAGYLGSMFWGALILIVAARTRYDRYVLLFIGFVVFILTVFYVREPFGIAFCLIFSAVMFGAFKFLPDWFNDYLLKFIGLTSCLYAIVDIKEDLIDRSRIGSDADAIARLLGLPSLSIAIGVIWIILSLVIMVISMKAAIAGNAPEEDRDENGSEPPQ